VLKPFRMHTKTPSPTKSRTYAEIIDDAIIAAHEAAHGPSEAEQNPSSTAAAVAPEAAPRHPGGRPSACTFGNIHIICQIIAELGVSDTAAAARAGIPASTLSRWKKVQPNLPGIFATAREGYRARLLQIMHEATTRDGRPDWRATAWLLERVFPEDYGRKRTPALSPEDIASTDLAAEPNASAAPLTEPVELNRNEADLGAGPNPIAPPVNDVSARSEPSETLETPATAALIPEAPTSKTSETRQDANPADSIPLEPQAAAFVERSLTASSVTRQDEPAAAPKAPDCPLPFASHMPEAACSETSETPVSASLETASAKPSTDSPLADAMQHGNGLSRRERRHRAHVQRMAERRALTAERRAHHEQHDLAAA
jgi:hypothetical protein